MYIGDVHSIQDEGEIAGKTADVSATESIQVHVIKSLKLGRAIDSL
ncbi:acetamidase/formamidase family protein [uncultured Peptoniphilus sp.]|nr:acetamidase/formamidase family protein [uncultured Peptoniphilus sp.]